MIRYLQLLVVGALLGLVLYVWIQHRLRGTSPVNRPAPTVLPKDDKEQIIVDPSRHTIIIKRPGGDVVTHLPDRPSVIDIKKDGTTVVTASQWGLELRPFCGGLLSVNGAKLALGADGLYWKRLDVGGGLAVRLNSSDPRLFVAVSYNVWSNVRIGLTIDHKNTVGALVSVRL